jgi:hypothetical protein
VKLALGAPAATVTGDGTETAVLLLERPTVRPPEPAAAFSDTVQESVPEPVIEPLVQVKPLSTPGPAVPVPVNEIVAFPDEVFVVRVTAPLAEPVAVGSKPTVRVAFWPGCNVTGKLPPVRLNPAPVTAPALMVTAAVLEEVRVTVCGVASVSTVTEPKLRLPALRVSPGAAAPSWIV